MKSIRNLYKILRIGVFNKLKYMLVKNLNMLCCFYIILSYCIQVYVQ